NANGEAYSIKETGEANLIPGLKATVIAVDPSDAAFVCVVYQGRLRVDLTKLEIDGSKLKPAGVIQRASAGNVYSVHLSPDGKQVGIVDGGGYDEANTRKRHYMVPVYSTADMKTMLGELEPNGTTAFHPVLPLAAVGKADGVNLVNTKTFAL